MSDLIDRQKAIDFIDAGHLCNPNEPRWSDNEVVNFLKSRPSAQPEPITIQIDHEPTADEIESLKKKLSDAPIVLQPERKTGRWIPCSERLPEERQDVIVTLNDGGIYTDTDEWTGMGFSAYGYNVIAWMPLPEAYKTEPDESAQMTRREAADHG